MKFWPFSVFHRVSAFALSLALPLSALTLVGAMSLAPQAEAAGAKELVSRARSGDVAAMRRLARSLWDGTSSHGRDHKLAIEWWQKAAKKGDDKSMVILAELYEKGLSVSQSSSKAREYYEKAARRGNEKAKKKMFGYTLEAAEKGDAEAQIAVAQCYEEGDGVEKDAKKAGEWYEKAAAKGNSKARRYMLGRLEKRAESGDDLAMFELAECYENGKYTSVDKSAALRWYRKSADAGFSDAKAAVKRLEEEEGITSSSSSSESSSSSRSSASSSRSSEDSEEDASSSSRRTSTATRKSAESWRSRITNIDLYGTSLTPDMDATLLYGDMVLLLTVLTDGQSARSLQINAANDNSAAGSLLGWACLTGALDVRPDSMAAARLFQKYSDHALGRLGLAFLYSIGEGGMPKDKDAAFRLYQEVSQELNLFEVYGCLAICYATGSGCLRDDEKAFECLLKGAAVMENTFCPYHIGLCYLDGRGVERSTEKAIEWLRKAARSGLTPAQKMLRTMGASW